MVGQEVLEAHVLTLLEDPAKIRTATVIIIHAKRAPVFLAALTWQCVPLFSFSPDKLMLKQEKTF
jgi:hypothetical protein